MLYKVSTGLYKVVIHRRGIFCIKLQTQYITEGTKFFVTSADFAAVSQFAPTKMGLTSQTLQLKL